MTTPGENRVEEATLESAAALAQKIANMTDMKQSDRPYVADLIEADREKVRAETRIQVEIECAEIVQKAREEIRSSLLSELAKGEVDAFGLALDAASRVHGMELHYDHPDVKELEPIMATALLRSRASQQLENERLRAEVEAYKGALTRIKNLSSLDARYGAGEIAKYALSKEPKI